MTRCRNDDIFFILNLTFHPLNGRSIEIIDKKLPKSINWVGTNRLSSTIGGNGEMDKL